jgi:hypothetical protein
MNKAPSAELVSAGRFACGPLDVQLVTSSVDLRAKLAETFSLYDLVWAPPRRPVHVWAGLCAAAPAPAHGSFLRCGRMWVDRTLRGLRATTVSGAGAECVYRDDGEQWHVEVAESVVTGGKLEELEDILSLVLTTGWRRAGWTPVHAAAVERDGVCVMLCAPTGGGKTTMTAALVRRGWRVLGDDKLLLHLADGEPEVAALLHTFNLHPQTRRWFPEVGDLEHLPRYSVWTEKRKVRVTDIWSGATALRARPRILVALNRSAEVMEAEIAPLSPTAVLETLLRQTVIPADRDVARPILTAIAHTASGLRGLRVTVPQDGYRDAVLLARLEEAFAA